MASTQTGAQLGVGAAILDIVNWWFTGHHFPIEGDTELAFIVVGGYSAHAIKDAISFFIQTRNLPIPGQT